MTTTELIDIAQQCAEGYTKNEDCPNDCPLIKDKDCKNHILQQMIEQLQGKHMVEQSYTVAVAAYRAMRQALIKFDDSMPAGEILTYLDGVCEMAEELHPALKPANVIETTKAGD